MKNASFNNSLATENANLRAENERLARENVALQQLVDAMKQQSASMAALFRGAQPTLEGRRAHAEQSFG